MIQLTRETGETTVMLRLAPAGVEPAPAGVIATGVPFLDHMLVTLARYAGWQLSVTVEGDLIHHRVEDTAITLGQAFRRILPASCARYGAATVPMDDALVSVGLDAGGRTWYEGPLPAPLYDHFLRSFSENAGLVLHVEVRRGTDRHHVVEAAMKALGLALRQASAVPVVAGPAGGEAVFSTKGAVRWTEGPA